MRRARIGSLLAPYALVFALIGIVIIFTVLLPETFPTLANLRIILASQAVLLVVALAETVPLRSGDFDLSVGSAMILSASVVGVLSANHGVPVWVSIPAGVILGALVGASNGLVVVLLKINPFIVTLGSLTIFEGLAFATTGSRIVSGFDPLLLAISRTQVLGLPLAVYLGWFLALLVWYAFEFTPFGRYSLFVGGNTEAARLAGVPVGAVRFISFVVAGALSGSAGVLLAGTLGAVNPVVGQQFLLPAFAAAFLGTTAVQPGRFNVLGTVLGVYLLVVVVTGLQLMGVATWITQVVNGAALVVAVTFARFSGGEATR